MRCLQLTAQWLIFHILMGTVLSANILVVHPMPSRSHQIVFKPLIHELARRGHHLTILTPFTEEKPVPNITEIQVQSHAADMMKTIEFEEFLKYLMYTPIVSPLPFWFVTYDLCADILQLPQVVELIQSNKKFDAIMLETFFGQESLLAFGHRFQAPVITLQPFGTYSLIDISKGNSLALSSVPDFQLAYTNKMSFIERLHNAVLITSEILFQQFYNLPKHEQIIKTYFPAYPGSSNIPSVSDMVKNISLVLINSHVCCSYPRPYAPNMIPIGGIHVSPKRKPLPSDLQKFMDEAKHGVIYFSLGSNIPDGKLPKHFEQAFVAAFGKLKQHVLWKIKSDSVTGLSSNVKLLKWAPQQDILAHPNCVLFITHGGVLSQHETIDAGVPNVGIPFFGDQPMNVKYSEDAGFGVKLGYHEINAETIYDKINTVLSNSSYRENARKLQILFRDRESSPLDTAVYWVEYVIRHKGAPHLQSPLPHMSWIEYMSLDIIAILLLSILTLLVLLYFIIKAIINLVCRKKPSKVTKSKKKN